MTPIERDIQLNAAIRRIEAALDFRDALRREGREYNREETRKAMAERNRLIAAREFNLRANPTVVSPERLAALRVKAGVADVSLNVTDSGDS